MRVLAIKDLLLKIARSMRYYALVEYMTGEMDKCRSNYFPLVVE